MLISKVPLTSSRRRWGEGMDESPATHRARVLTLPSVVEAQREIDRIGPMPPALRWLADKAALRAVRLENVRGKAANILKQQMLALGGDCAVSPQVANFDDTPRAAILLGTRRHYERLLPKLRRQPLGLPQIAEEVEKVLDHCEELRRPPLHSPCREIPVGERTLVMGVINMTPDSFSGDGLEPDKIHSSAESARLALQQAQEFATAGADIIDIGAESTRPGSQPVTADEELGRVLPALAAIRAAVDLPISIDTSKGHVAQEALAHGAALINDVSGLRGAGMMKLAAQTGVPVVIMHMQGQPRDMQHKPTYQDLITEIYDFLAARIEACVAAGINEQQIIVDPGFGFGKTVNHNLEIIRRLREFRSLGRPILIGPSRKSTIGKVLDRPPPERLWGTAATCAAAIMNGADIIRVHDVAQMTEVARMTDAIMRGRAE